MLRVPVSFGNCNVGDETANLGVKIDRTSGGPTLDDMESYFCGKQIVCRIVRGGPPADQKQIPGTEDAYDEIEGTAKVKGFSVRTKAFSLGLAYDLGQGDRVCPAGLSKFARKKGFLEVESAVMIADGPEEDDDEEDDDSVLEDHDDVGPLHRSSSRPRGAVPPHGSPDIGGEMSILDAFKPYCITKDKCEKLADACEGKSVAALEDFIRRDPNWHGKIKGFGDVWINKTVDAITEHRRLYPMPCSEPQPEPEPEAEFSTTNYATEPEEVDA